MDGRASNAVLLCLGLALQFAFLVTGLTTDPPTMDGGTVVLPRVANAANVSVFCRVTFMGVPRSTVWFVTRLNGQREELTLNPPSDPNFILHNSAVDSNLTIVSFSSDLDMVTLECTNNVEAPNREEAFFNLRIIGPPVLNSVSTAEIGVENSPFSFISIVQTPGYPDPPLYQWLHDGIAINTTTSTNPNVSVYPNIVFSSVVRTQSGNYSMTASTDGGDSTGYFILDVHYPVAAGVSGTQMYYGVEGGSVTLVAHVNITGNPVPGSVWMFNGATARGDAVVSGQLTITNLTPADSGNYTNTLNNTLNDGNISSISNTVGLQVLIPPSAPANLNVTNVGADFVMFNLKNPSFSGLPPFIFFKMELGLTANSLSVNVITRKVPVSNTDPSFTNTLTVDRLQPNTNYSVRIRAVSTLPTVDEILGMWSSVVTFITMLGDPSFALVNLENVAGKLKVSWSFEHTGGVPILGVMINCHSSKMSSDLLMETISCGNTNMTFIPIGVASVTAGMNYSCSVTATNKFASVQHTSNYIIAKSGFPSLPVITQVTTGVESVILTVQLYAGHPTVLLLNVTATDQTGGNITFANLLQSGAIKNTTEYSVKLPLPPGVYHFTVHASNLFGNTVRSDVFPLIHGIEVVHMDISAPMSVPATPVLGNINCTGTSTGTGMVTNTLVIGLGLVLAVCIIVIGVQLIFIVAAVLYIKRMSMLHKGESQTVKTRADMQYEAVDPHNKQQNIELQSNTAYASLGEVM